MSDTITLNVSVNGESRSAEIDPRRLLVETIREDLDLPGTHVGCLTGDCGACTVEVDGQIVKSCLRLAASAEGTDITTIEGLAENGELSTIQQAFWDEYGFQCGFCLPGMLFSAKDLLAQNPSPSEAEIRQAINGTLCRCTGYDTIVKSIAEAAARMA
jgi:aerobic-type carbon monoxide dehydrogenase small subunit (CoxS/CutS family)